MASKRAAESQGERPRLMVAASYDTELFVGALQYLKQFIEDAPFVVRPFDKRLTDEERAQVSEFDGARWDAGLRIEGMNKAATIVAAVDLPRSAAAKGKSGGPCWAVYRVVPDRSKGKRHPWKIVETVAEGDAAALPFVALIKIAPLLSYVTLLSAEGFEQVQMRFVEDADSTLVGVAPDLNDGCNLIQNKEYREDEAVPPVQLSWRLRMLLGIADVRRLMKYFAASNAKTENVVGFTFGYRRDGPAREDYLEMQAVQVTEGVETRPTKRIPLRHPQDAPAAAEEDDGEPAEAAAKKKKAPRRPGQLQDETGRVLLCREDDPVRLATVTFSAKYMRDAFMVPTKAKRLEASFGRREGEDGRPVDIPLFLNVALDDSGKCAAKVIVAPHIAKDDEVAGL